jgi:hypothetical protein
VHEQQDIMTMEYASLEDLRRALAAETPASRVTAGAFGKIERAMHGPADGAVAARIKRDATHRATPNSCDPG